MILMQLFGTKMQIRKNVNDYEILLTFTYLYLVTSYLQVIQGSLCNLSLQQHRRAGLLCHFQPKGRTRLLSGESLGWLRAEGCR